MLAYKPYLLPLIAVFCVSGCGAPKEDTPAIDGRSLAAEPNVSGLSKEVQELIGTTSPVSDTNTASQKEEAQPQTRQCDLVVEGGGNRIFHADAPEALLKADAPCMLSPTQIKTLPAQYQVPFYILAKNPELLNDESVFYAYACINDRPAVEHFIGNEFAWPKVQESILSRAQAQLQAFETLTVETFFAQTHLLGKYDRERGGFPVIARPGFSSMPIDGLNMNNPSQFQACKNGVGGLQGNEKNWYGSGYPFEFEFTPSISDMFVPMPADEAEAFISKVVPETSREVQLSVKFSLGTFTRGFGNKAIFQTTLDAVTVEHVAFDQPLEIKIYSQN